MKRISVKDSRENDKRFKTYIPECVSIKTVKIIDKVKESNLLFIDTITSTLSANPETVVYSSMCLNNI